MSEDIVFVVDDEETIRTSLQWLIQSYGNKVEVFSTTQEFLGHKYSDEPSRAILDICLAGLNGLDLQDRMAALGLSMPIIFITGYGSLPMGVRAMKVGVFDFLKKPRRKTALPGICFAVKNEILNRYGTLPPPSSARFLTL